MFDSKQQIQSEYNNLKSMQITDSNWNNIIKFRSLNTDHNYIFIKQNNTIKIYNLLQLKPLYSLHVDSPIVSFEIIAKSSKLILNTEKQLLLYEFPELNTIHTKDFQMKLKFKQTAVSLSENIISISISPLSDLIVTIDKFKTIKFFDLDLKQIKSFNLREELDILLYNFFQVTYDTKNICLAAYCIHESFNSKELLLKHYHKFKTVHSSILFLYKNLSYNGNSGVTKFGEYSNNNSLEEREFLISNCSEVLNGQTLAYIKEMQKNIDSYVESSQSSIFFILTNQHSFLITRKIIDRFEKPELISISYLRINEVVFDKLLEIHDHNNKCTPTNISINNNNKNDYLYESSDVSNSCKYDDNDRSHFRKSITNIFQNPVSNFNYSFSLLYGYENPIHNTSFSLNTKLLQSYLIEQNCWAVISNYEKQKDFDEEDLHFQQKGVLYNKPKIDYIMFKYQNKIFIYQVEGLNKSALHEIILSPYKAFNINPYKTNITGNLLLLKFTKNNDNKHSALFLDENNLLRKFTVNNTCLEEEASLKIFHNIKSISFNKKNRKLLILEYSNENTNSLHQINSVIVITNQKMYLTKVFYIEGIKVKNLKWVDNELNVSSDWSFASLFSFSYKTKIYFFNFRSKYFYSRINKISLNEGKEKGLLYVLDSKTYAFGAMTSSSKLSGSKKSDSFGLDNNEDSKMKKNENYFDKNNIDADVKANENDDNVENGENNVEDYFISVGVNNACNNKKNSSKEQQNNDTKDKGNDKEEFTKIENFENTDTICLNIFVHTGYLLTSNKLSIERNVNESSQNNNKDLPSKLKNISQTSLSNNDNNPNYNYQDVDETQEPLNFIFKKDNENTMYYSIFCFESQSYLNFQQIAIYENRVYYYFLDIKHKFGVLKEIFPCNSVSAILEKQDSSIVDNNSGKLTRSSRNLYKFSISNVKNNPNESDKFSKFNYLNNSNSLIFDFVLQGEFLYSGFFDNELLVIITDCHIDSYSISSRYYSRMKNHFYLPQDIKQEMPYSNNNPLSSLYYNNSKRIKSTIGSKKISNFTFLYLITENGIRFERVPKNKSLFENFEIKFNHKLFITNTAQFISNLIVLNNQQIEFLSDVGSLVTSKELRYDFTSNTLENKLQNMILLNINPNSLFELETFLDYYLDDREDLVRKLLEYYYKQQNVLIEEKFDVSLISTKGLPNLFNLSVEEIYGLLFDNEILDNSEKSNNDSNQISTIHLESKRKDILYSVINKKQEFERRDTVLNENVDFNRKIIDKEYNQIIDKKAEFSRRMSFGIKNKNEEFNLVKNDLKQNDTTNDDENNINNKYNIKIENDFLADYYNNKINNNNNDLEEDIFTMNEGLSLSKQTERFYRIERNILYMEQIEEKINKTNSINNNTVNLNNNNDTSSNNIITTETNETNLIFNQNSRVTNLRHLVYLYETYISEATRKLDHITKYFIIKIKSKSQALNYSSFRLTSSDLCWLNLINDQEYILKFLLIDKKNITYKSLQRFCIPLWIKNEFKLKELLEITGKNEYNLLLKNEYETNIGNTKNIAEQVALYFYLAGKMNLVFEKYDKEAHNTKILKFLKSNFKDAKAQKQARENAIVLLTKKRFMIAAMLFLLGNDIRSAVEVCIENLRDINLAICVIKLYPSVCTYYNKDVLAEEEEKIYSNNFVKFGKLVRDPWLVVYSYLVRNKFDICLEYIQNFSHYNLIEGFFDNENEDKNVVNNNFGNNYFGNNAKNNNSKSLPSSKNNNNILNSNKVKQPLTPKQLTERIAKLENEIDFVNSEYEIINNIVELQLFDYKLIFFLKEVEKLYQTELSNQMKSQQSVANTNFDDIWGDSDDDTSTPTVSATANANSNATTLKDIKPYYDNILEKCLEDAINKGVIFSSIISKHLKNTGELYPKTFDRNINHSNIQTQNKSTFYTHHKQSNNEISSYNNHKNKSSKSPLVLFYNLICERAILDTVNLLSMNNNRYLQDYIVNLDKILQILENAGFTTKKEFYSLMNMTYLKIEKYNFAIFSSYKSSNVLSTLKKVEREIENHAIDLLYETFFFNFKENISISKQKDFLRNRIYPMIYLIQELLKMQSKKSYFNCTEPEINEKIVNNNSTIRKRSSHSHLTNSLTELEKDKCQVVFIIRILVKCYTILLGVSKIAYKYNLFNQIHKDLTSLCQQYFDIIRYPLNLYYHLENIFEYSKALVIILDQTSNDQLSTETPTMFFIILINSSLLSKVKLFFETKTYDVSLEYIPNYINEFKFIKRFKKLLYDSYVIFSNEIERFINKYIDMKTRSEVLNELKSIYMSSSSNDTKMKKTSDYSKFNKINISYLFPKEIHFINFSNEYPIDAMVSKFCYKIPLFYKYEKPENPIFPYTKESVEIVSKLFGRNGVEIVRLNDESTITGFDFDSCNMNHLSFGLQGEGHKRYVVSNSLVKQKRSDGKFYLYIFNVFYL